MSLEGRLRELGLAEVLQLLGLSRKTGVLELQAQLAGRLARIYVLNGTLVDAYQWNEHDDEPPVASIAQRSAKKVAACMFELLAWRDGDFRFMPDRPVSGDTGVKLSVDSILVEAHSSAEAWDAIRDHIPHQRVIPAFVDVEPKSLPLLRLVPQEWEILTRVDGTRDLHALAQVLGREVLDVAVIVHRLIGAGLLTLRETSVVPATNATPPVVTAIAYEPEAPATTTTADVAGSIPDDVTADPDLWIPTDTETFQVQRAPSTDDEDAVFDPVASGVFTSDGPLWPAVTAGAPANGPVGHAQTATPIVAPKAVLGVAPTRTQPSLIRGDASPSPETDNAESLCQHGDEAARRGDLAGALTYWSAALRSDATMVDADRIREAIALAARLHALLHPAAKRA